MTRLTNSPRTWESWTDVLGQEYRPGDYVAYASINGRSPQLVIAKVVRINRVDSKGEEIMASRYDRTTRLTEHAPSCSVTVRPVLDARDFSRWSRNAQTGEAKAVTMRIPENVIKVDASNLP